MIICSRDDLRRGLNIVKGAISEKNIIAVLTNVYFKAQKEKNLIELMANNLNIGIKTEIEGEIEEDIEIAIIGKQFINMINQFKPEAEIKLTYNKEKNIVNIRHGRGKYTLQCLPGNEFYKIPDMPETRIKLNKSILKEAIKEISIAMGTEEEKAIFRGMYMAFNENIEFIATDSYRLSFKAIPWEKEELALKEIIIPAESIKKLNEILSMTENDDVFLSINKNQIILKIDNIVFTSRLLEGNYPREPIGKIINSFNPDEKAVKINRNEFIDCINRVSSISSDNYNCLNLNFTNKILEINLNSNQNKAVEEIDIEITENPTTDFNINLNINAKYLLEILKSIKTDNVILYPREGNKPLFLKKENDDNYINFLMPLRK